MQAVNSSFLLAGARACIHLFALCRSRCSRDACQQNLIAADTQRLQPVEIFRQDARMMFRSYVIGCERRCRSSITKRGSETVVYLENRLT